jgi:NO-binding membrane sensor protein with MHYT domain
MDPVIGQLLVPQYSGGMATLSYLISFLGSLLALMCAGRMVRADGTLDVPMLACAAIALGGVGIWSMHFIGMVAYRLPVTISYHVGLTAASLLAAVVISGVALYLAGGKRKFSRGGWVAGSVLAGLGACVMHYMGMYAMALRATMTFDAGLVAASIAIALVAAAAALWLAFNLTHFYQRVIAAAVMGVAVSVMHYVGMAAADMVCTAPAEIDEWTVGGRDMGLVVFALSGAVLIWVLWMVSGRWIAAQRAGHHVQA